MTTGHWIGLGMLVVIWSAAAAWIVHRKSRRIKELERQLHKSLGIIGEKNGWIAELEQSNTDLDQRNGRLHEDLRRMRGRLPQLADEPPRAVRPHLSLDPNPTRMYVLSDYLPSTEDEEGQR